MNVNDVINKLNLNILVQGDTTREVSDCYVGDLLSWVMGRAPEDSIWLTVMGNINSIAVATLADVACIVLVENASLDNDAKQKAEALDVTILQSEENAYHLATKIYELLK